VYMPYLVNTLDSWHEDHKQKFTDEQLLVLTELLVSPNYYA